MDSNSALANALEILVPAIVIAGLITLVVTAWMKGRWWMGVAGFVGVVGGFIAALDLFAAMNVATGEVLHDTRQRHAGRDVLAFFKLVDVHVPADVELHVILDKLSAHKSEPVQDWLDLCVPEIRS